MKKITAATRAKMAESQRKRWAKNLAGERVTPSVRSLVGRLHATEQSSVLQEAATVSSRRQLHIQVEDVADLLALRRVMEHIPDEAWSDLHSSSASSGGFVITLTLGLGRTREREIEETLLNVAGLSYSS